MLNPSEIDTRLKLIRLFVTPRPLAGRDGKMYQPAPNQEAAHAYTDRLYIDALVDIADGAEEPAKMAQQVLRAEDIEFERWRIE